MLRPIRDQFGQRGKAVGLDLRAIGIDIATITSRPGIVARSEQAIGTLKRLQKLPRCVDIALAGCEDTVIERSGARGHGRMRGFRDEVIKPTLL